MNLERKNRHLAFGKRNRESRSVIFSNPAVPIIFPASGLRVEPLTSLNIPLTITKVNYWVVAENKENKDVSGIAKS